MMNNVDFKVVGYQEEKVTKYGTATILYGTYEHAFTKGLKCAEVWLYNDDRNAFLGIAEPKRIGTIAVFQGGYKKGAEYRSDIVSLVKFKV